MNQGQFAGRLGRDAVLRATPSGKSVLTFPVGVDVWGGAQQKTLWVNCSLWGPRAEKLSMYLLKGTAVSVAGDIDLRTWEKDDRRGATLDLRVSTVTLLARPATESAPRLAAPRPPAAPTPKQPPESEVFIDDEIDF